VQFKAVTGTEIAFAAGGYARVVAAARDAQRPRHADDGARRHVGVLRGEEYVMVSRPFARAGTAADPEWPHHAHPVTHRTAPLLSTLRAGLAGALIVTLLLATVSLTPSPAR
jgi:hypothetical protein